MSSREEILASIRKNTQVRYDKPDIADMKQLSYPDKIEQFCAISRAVGGMAVVLGCRVAANLNEWAGTTRSSWSAVVTSVAGYFVRDVQSR